MNNMNNRILNVVCFAAGAGIGWLVACKMMCSAFAELAQEEIDSVKEVYNKRLEELEAPLTEEETAEIVKSNPHKPSIKEYAAARLKELRDESEEDDEYMYGPEVVSPEEFDENVEDYEKVTLYLYNDGKVVYEEDDHPMTDKEIDDTIGHEALNTFGQFEDDSVFVRNDSQQSYYEILARDENWTDANIPND